MNTYYKKLRRFWRAHRQPITNYGIIPLSVIIVVVCIGTYYSPNPWGRPEVLKLTIGYWGELNRLLYAFEAIPEAEVLDYGAEHLDMDLLAMKLKLDSGEVITLEFPAGDPARNMPHTYMIAQLKQRIVIELNKPDPKPEAEAETSTDAESDAAGEADDSPPSGS